MPYPGLMTDRIELVGGIHADLHQGTYYTPWYSAAGRQRWLFLLDVGDITATGTVDFQVQEAQDNVGTGQKAITAKTTTQLTAAGGDGDDYLGVNLGTAEMDSANAFDHVRARLRVLTASANVSLLILADALDYKPPSTAIFTELLA